MKKILIVLLLILSLTGCDSGAIVHDEYIPSYGLMSVDKKRDDVAYQISIKNAIITMLFSETIIVPILYLLEYVYIPVEAK
ncbi:MAG: hypothetical protein EOM67_16825 [Spirochaetia bacterium]|nr:hypothetical protein [Spirochaetia bacterium]